MTNDADGYNTFSEFYNGFGNPDLSPTGQNPTILPTFDPYVAGPNGENFVTPSVFLQQYPRVNAVGSITLGGSVTAGDTVGIDIIHPILPNGIVQVSTLATGSDTLATIANRLSLLININSTLQSYGVVSDVAGAVINVNWPGPLGNFAQLSGWSYSYSNAVTFGGSVTTGDIVSLTFASGNFPANSAAVNIGGTGTAGDVVNLTFSGPPLASPITISYTVAGGNTPATIASGLATAIAANSTLATGLTMVTNTNGSQLFISYNGAAGLLSLSSTVTRAGTETIALTPVNNIPPSSLTPSPAPSELIVIGGSVTTGDVLSLSINWPTLVQPVILSYTTIGGDTTSTIATAIAALINANPFLQAAGFVAVVTANQITLTWSLFIGFIVGFVANVVGAPSETVAITNSPTSLQLNYTTAGGNSLTNVAAAFVTAINANVILASAGVLATNSGAVLTFEFNQFLLPMAFGGASVVSGGGSPGTETVTWAGINNPTVTMGGSATAGDNIWLTFSAPQLPSGAYRVGVPVTGAETLAQMAAALANAVNINDTLANAGISATSQSSVISVATQGGFEPPTVAGYATPAAKLWTLSGTPTAGDVLNLSFNNTVFTTNPYIHQYVVQATDTTLTILAASVAASLNNDTTLAAAGFTFTSNAAVVSIIWNGFIGTVTFAESTNGVEIVTVGGTITNGDAVVLTITDASVTGSPVALTYHIATADTLATIAAGLAALVNANANLAASGITATNPSSGVVHVASTSKVATTYAKTNGSTATLTLSGGPGETGALTGSASETLTTNDNNGSETATAVQPVGGSGALLIKSNFVLTLGEATQNFWRGVPVLVTDYHTLSSMISSQLPVV